MAKISPVGKNPLAKILKKRNVQNAKKIKTPEVKAESVAVTTTSAQDLAFDSYLRSTAREMLEGMTRVDLQVNKSSVQPEKLYRLSAENSIWAPWTALFKAGK